MSLPAILERIAQIDQIVSPRPPASTGGSSSSAGFLTALNTGIERGSALAAPAAAPAVPGTGGRCERRAALDATERGHETRRAPRGDGRLGRDDLIDLRDAREDGWQAHRPCHRRALPGL